MGENEKESRPLSRMGRINRRMLAGASGESKQWWQDSPRRSRRKFIVGGALASLGLIGGVWLATRKRGYDETNTTEVEKDSLELQRAEGWNVGSEDKPLNFPNRTELDSQRSDVWKKYLNPNEMLRVYQPKDAAWQPFFVPTLIQSLQFDSLRAQLTPISTPDMQEAYGRGQSIAQDFLENAANARETAIIVDLIGRNAVAFGAGLAEAARLVPLFDNFPHPLGVTPSHETLAAMLFYAGEVEAKQALIGNDAPPVFLIDSNRLADYKDADNQFDNRYLAKLPSADKLKERGVKAVLYVTPDRTRTQELDDLNDDFVAYRNAGLNVAMLPLSDFVAVREQLANNQNATQNANNANRSHTPTTHYYYGGSYGSHYYFFRSYPFYNPSPMFARRYPNITSELSRTRIGRSAPISAPSISPPSYAPVSRPTMFSASRVGVTQAGVGRSKPSGFGRTSVRISSEGRVTGTRSGRSGSYSGRSGSFGRTGSGSSG